LTLAWAAAPAQATTQTFTYTGAEQTFKVPGGVTSIHVVAIGGSGGASGAVLGGEGASVTGDVTVTPGDTIYFEVGGNGLSSGLGGGLGGFNGGGDGGSSSAGGGGGASDIRTSPLEDGLAPDLRLIVAAGGGGAGAEGEISAGAAGGAAGSDGADTTTENPGGNAGTATEGGAGGEGFFGFGGDGELGLGGAGGASGFSGGTGGGGGGGYYGGGGGGGGEISGGGGGGGGSSLIPPSGLQSLTASPPQVEITYTLVPPTIEIASPANGAAYQQGEVVKASYSCTPPEGTTVEACEGPVANGAAIDTSTLGPHAFEVEAEDKDGAEANKEVTYTVVASPSISITSPANGATFTQGQAVTAIYSCTPAGGTGVKTCAGPVANGAALDTAALGSHSFEVKAEDLDGGKATQSVSYTVAPAPVACPLGGTAQSNELCPPGPPHSPALPSTALDSHPKSKIETTKKKVKVKFTFSSNTSGATFKCKLDKGSFAPCASPKTYKVKLGKHTLSVEAVSAGGTDPTPATFSFKVKKKS
jgi:hypothetical protein